MPSAAWLKAALDYLPRWLEFQMRLHQQPGCAVAIVHRGRIVLEAAFGYADAVKRTPLTPRHLFRVASHSKSFTAAGIMKLREQKRLRLGDAVGRYVGGLHPALARATLAELLSHTGGVVRDGPDAGQFVDRRPFLTAAELRAQLQAPPVLRRNTRFKYSNHGYGLLGLVIEALGGEPYGSWIRREIIEAAGLEETFPDAPLPKGVRLASGHSGRLPLGRRVVIPGGYSTHAIAPAGGFTGSARDIARFFAQLAPRAKRSVLSSASRREMIRRRWRDPHSSFERYYGLGIISGSAGDKMSGWDWFGHSGGLQGYITRTAVLPRQDLALAVFTNSIDGLAHWWLDGAIHILRAFARHGAPARGLRDWSGRWWTLWNAIDLVPTASKVLVATPALFNPFMDAPQLKRGRIVLASGYASHGEPARLVRDRRGAVAEVWLGGTRYLPDARVRREMQARYE
ncbi:MAG TPA: serine hydrolase domain-containing protein [Burkholderiales bacterium]|nr:serine hydrolase domain-containing protein [Burkholderiales bacterium]